mmetsp:Transcript_32880/g.84250  ORF Transcript_32880/g.84250 Transcript_32880/m.84250 type:complete len:347 (+) Transcript_32880:862-1902(+)
MTSHDRERIELGQHPCVRPTYLRSVGDYRIPRPQVGQDQQAFPHAVKRQCGDIAQSYSPVSDAGVVKLRHLVDLATLDTDDIDSLFVVRKSRARLSIGPVSSIHRHDEVEAVTGHSHGANRIGILVFPAEVLQDASAIDTAGRVKRPNLGTPIEVDRHIQLTHLSPHGRHDAPIATREFREGARVCIEGNNFAIRKRAGVGHRSSACTGSRASVHWELDTRRECDCSRHKVDGHGGHVDRQVCQDGSGFDAYSLHRVTNQNKAHLLVVADSDHGLLLRHVPRNDQKIGFHVHRLSNKVCFLPSNRATGIHMCTIARNSEGCTCTVCNMNNPVPCCSRHNYPTTAAG